MEAWQPDRRPLYAQVYDRLRTMIQENDLEPGQQLPSEAEMASQLGISRATLREALRLLEEEGHILRRHGVGTFVAPSTHLESGLERLESILTLAARAGMETRVRDLEVDTIAAERPLVDRLRVPSKSPLTRIRRTILIEDQPAAYMDDIVPARWLSPDRIESAFAGSVLDLLRQQQALRIQEARADICAICATSSLSQRLAVQRGTALLLLEETLFDVEGAPIGFSRNYFVPERFRFHVVRR